MLACVSPADVNMEESVNTLRYAARARNIRNKPVINRDPHAAQIALLRQQLAAAHAENAALRRAAAAGGVGISIPDSLRGSAETSESILAEALDELQAANSKLEVEKTRLQLEVVTLKAELGEKTDALLSVEAQRDTLLLKLQRARAGDCSVRSSITDGAPQEMRADDGLAANGVTGMHGDVRDPAPADELVDEDLQVDDVVKKYLRKIARLEKEVKRLKQVQRVSGAFIVQQRRQSLTPLRANLPMEGGATPLSGAPLPPPDTPGGFDFSLDQPCDEEALAEDEHFVVEEHAHRVEQKRVQAELEGLQRTLEAKEAQMARMVGGRGQISAMKQHYDRILADLQNERDDLARERAELVQRPGCRGSGVSVKLQRGCGISVKLQRGSGDPCQSSRGARGISVKLLRGCGISVKLQRGSGDQCQALGRLGGSMSSFGGAGGISVKLQRGCGISVKLQKGSGDHCQASGGSGINVKFQRGSGDQCQASERQGGPVSSFRGAWRSVSSFRGALGVSVNFSGPVGISVKLQRGWGGSVSSFRGALGSVSSFRGTLLGSCIYLCECVRRSIDHVGVCGKQQRGCGLGAQRLHALRESTEEGKAAAEKRLKKALQEMDARMKEVAAREKKAAQVDRLAARSQEAVARLQQDIAAIKQQKVALARQMEKSAREFQEWKRGREREVLQLKRQGLKTAAQVQRLEALQAKQQAVLRRKTEEAESARRRLKDIMEVHRQAGEQRKERAALGRSSSQPGTSVECQPNNTAPLLRDEKARREWLEHELDLCCQSFELQKVLEGEKAMRADAAHQLQELERRAARPAPPDPDTAAQLEALRAKVRHHSGQILETQQALVAAKAEDTARGGGSAGADVRRWTGLRNLVEARALLKTLFRSAAQLRAQVYETASELTEAREESEVLRIRFEAAEQEVEAARQAAAAAQAAAMLAHSKSPCPSPQRPSQLSHPIPEEDEALESLIGEIEDFPERNPLDDVDNADGLPPLSRPTSLLRSRDSNPHQHPHQEPSPRRQLFVQQRPAWRNEIPEEPDDEDEEEEEEDEDDEKWGEDPAWDPSSATPAIGNRRRPRGSTAMRSGSLPLHVLGTQEGPSPATAHRIVRGEQEAPVLMAINAERARQGEPRVDRLTVRILKAHLQGKSVAGRRWSASGKKREDLIADFRAYLGMGELKGEGMAAMTPRVPQLEGTPGTGSSRGSPGALSERSRMSHSAEQLPRGRPISPALDPLDSANSDTASGSPQRAGHAGGDPVAKLVPPLALKDNDSAAELGSDFILEGRTAAGGSRPSSGRPAGLELWHNTLGTGPRPQETGPGARLARGMDSLQSATLGMVPREPVPGVQDPELLSVEGHGLRILQDWPSGPPPTGVARTPAARFYLDECSAALRRAQALRARLGSRASRGLPSLSPSSSPSGSIGQRGPSPSSLDRPPRPTSAAPEHADPAEAFSPPVSCPPLHSGPIAPCENFSLDGAAPPGPDTEPPPPFSDFSPAGRTVLGDIANAGEPKLVRTGSLGSGGAALEVAASLKPAKESASAAKPPKPLPVLPNIVVPKVAGPPGEAKTGATPRARAWL
eukprot:jgi/Botrbrau1/12848/Bobra.0045s0017.1